MNVLATGIELTDHIFLRLNKTERKAVSIAFFDYSVLVQKTEMGTRNFPLVGLSQLSSELREIVLELLLSKPVSEYIYLSAYSPSINEVIPIVSLPSIFTAVSAA